jgi:adenylate kinase
MQMELKAQIQSLIQSHRQVAAMAAQMLSVVLVALVVVHLHQEQPKQAARLLQLVKVTRAVQAQTMCLVSVV